MAVSLVPLQLREVWMALPAEVVQEILGERPWVAIAGAPAELPGVLSWRGRAIAVLDLGTLVKDGSPIATGQLRRRTLVVEHGGCTLAVPIDAVREVQEVSADRVRTAQVTQQRFADKEVEIDGIPMPVLDLAAVLQAISPAPASASASASG
jgi:chemotaxis signal transduction protein